MAMERKNVTDSVEFFFMARWPLRDAVSASSERGAGKQPFIVAQPFDGASMKRFF
jgi:hypothetical protein